MCRKATPLTLPPADWTRVLVVIMHAMTRAMDLLVGSSRVSRWLYRAFNRRSIDGFLGVLARKWGVADD